MVHRKVLLAFFVAVVFVMGLALGAGAEVYEIPTSENQYRDHLNNSGYWSNWEKDPTELDDSYLIGFSKKEEGLIEYRNFFSFDLSGLRLDTDSIVSAWIEAPLVGVKDAEFKKYMLHDVQTDVKMLMQTGERHVNEKIFADLGEGTWYGSYEIPEIPDPIQIGDEFILEMVLEDAALINIIKSLETRGWFSVGGALHGYDENGPKNQLAFIGTKGRPVTLFIETRDQSDPAAVPEPATILGFGVPMLMVGLGRLRALRK